MAWFPKLKSKDEKVDSLLDSAEGDMIDIGNQTCRSSLRKLLIFVAGILFVILIWYLVAETYNVFFKKTMSFPSPVIVFEMVYDFFTTNIKIFGNNIAAHTRASLIRWVKGFILAFVIGMGLGVILGSSERLYQFGMVPVNLLQIIPGLAWLPVAILLLGVGENAAVFIIAITVISPIALSVSNGLRRVPKVNLRVAAMSGRNAFERFTEVLIPFATMDILTGLRIGMANGWRMLISAEMVVGVALGLGFAINFTSSIPDYVSSFACIVIIAIIGIVIDKVILASIESYARGKLGVEAV